MRQEAFPYSASGNFARECAPDESVPSLFRERDVRQGRREGGGDPLCGSALHTGRNFTGRLSRITRSRSNSRKVSLSGCVMMSCETVRIRETHAHCRLLEAPLAYKLPLGPRSPDVNFHNEFCESKGRLHTPTQHTPTQVGQRRLLKLRSAIPGQPIFVPSSPGSFYRYSRGGLGG